VNHPCSPDFQKGPWSAWSDVTHVDLSRMFGFGASVVLVQYSNEITENGRKEWLLQYEVLPQVYQWLRAQYCHD